MVVCELLALTCNHHTGATGTNTNMRKSTCVNTILELVLGRYVLLLYTSLQLILPLLAILLHRSVFLVQSSSPSWPEYKIPTR